MQVHDKLLAQVYRTLWQHIWDFGELLKPDHPQMGGIWSADTHVLGNAKALMSDGGYGTGIIVLDDNLQAKLNCFIAYGGNPINDDIVHFTVGDANDLRQAALDAAKV